MLSLQDVLQQDGVADRVRQFLGPRVQWTAALHQTTTSYRDYLQGFSSMLESSYRRAMWEEELRDSQTWVWRIHRDPHEEFRDLLAMHTDEYVSEADALHVLRREARHDFDSPTGWSTSSSNRWSMGS